jgi:hypothetical protein
MKWEKQPSGSYIAIGEDATYHVWQNQRGTWVAKCDPQDGERFIFGYYYRSADEAKAVCEADAKEVTQP